ncbi:MAG TPA: hypothetical protein VHJ82_09930 [Actinomycetota bacterium]|nr:hypothetical protein [Actinomycetota bacterium]
MRGLGILRTSHHIPMPWRASGPRAGKSGASRNLLLALVALGAVLASSAPAPAGPLDGWSSPNVEFVKNVRVDLAGVSVSETWGATLRGRYLYVTGWGVLTIFDVSRPEDPVKVSQLPAQLSLDSEVGAIADAREDPDTNGTILPTLISLTPFVRKELVVVDVSNKAEPEIISRLRLTERAHTISCLDDCRWAYISDGHIIDLRDPRDPQLEPVLWNEQLRFFPTGFGPSPVHDVTEVAEDLVLTASVPIYLLDTSNPLRPIVLAQSDSSPYSFGGVAWPNAPHSSLVLSFSEPGAFPAPGCKVRDALQGTSYDSALATWDAAHWRRTGIFTRVDAYFPSDGVFADGNPPVSATHDSGCSASWFDLHPNFRERGLVAAAFYGNGVKFLQVSQEGKFEEQGYWLPSTSAVFGSIDAEWADEDTVYAISIDRGIDVLRFTAPKS